MKCDEEHAFVVDDVCEVYLIKYSEKSHLRLKEMSTKLKEIAVPPAKAKSPLNLKIALMEEDQDVVW